MKTIRKDVFETNSSSTHSISIINKGTIPYATYKLCVDNILYPKELESYQIEVKSNYNDDYILSCDTKDKKTALVCHWIKAIFDSPTVINEFFNYLEANLNYDGIDRNFESKYHPYEDESFNLFDSYNAVIKDLDPLIEIILDDNKVIKVEYYEH